MPSATKSRPAVSILKQYIGGKWVEGTHASAADSVNPADTRDVFSRGRAQVENGQWVGSTQHGSFLKRTPRLEA